MIPHSSLCDPSSALTRCETESYQASGLVKFENKYKCNDKKVMIISEAMRRQCNLVDIKYRLLFLLTVRVQYCTKSRFHSQLLSCTCLFNCTEINKSNTLISVTQNRRHCTKSQDNLLYISITLLYQSVKLITDFSIEYLLACMFSMFCGVQTVVAFLKVRIECILHIQ